MALVGFPNFSDGNVEIYFSEDEKYVVHSWLLALHSPWFKKSLSDCLKFRSSDTAAVGKHHWVYELRFDKDSDLATLLQKASPDAASSAETELMLDSKVSFTGDETSGLKNRRVMILEAHRNIIRCLYHVRPPLDLAFHDSSKNAMVQLAKAAEIYECEAIVKLQIHHHLQTWHHAVEEMCADSSFEMIDFAIGVKSEWVFNEAATHLVGRSNRVFNETEEALDDEEVVMLLEKHRETFVNRLKDCELKLFRLRAPREHWLSHAALNFFQHWLTDQLTTGKGSELGPGYANLYHSIHKGLYASNVAKQKQQVKNYMTRVYQNVTEDNLRDVDAEIKTVFTNATAVVEPLLKQNTRWQNPRKDDFRALTFMDIDVDELSWAE